MRFSSVLFLATLSTGFMACNADENDSGNKPAVAGNSSTGGSPTTGGTPSNGGTPTATGGSSDGGSTSKSGSASGGGGASGGSGGGGSMQMPLALPFFVNAPGNFVKSGFMGDAMTSVTAAPSETDTDGTCGGKRADDKAGGDCDTFKIKAAEGGMGWQGVFYQFPANNWGEFPGRTIATGAKQVKFQARASREVAVMFQVGMCNPADETMCTDGFFAYPTGASEGGTISVGTEWKELTVSLAGKDYSGGVHGAFSWSVSNADLLGDMSELDLYVDAISWE